MGILSNNGHIRFAFHVLLRRDGLLLTRDKLFRTIPDGRNPLSFQFANPGLIYGRKPVRILPRQRKGKQGKLGLFGIGRPVGIARVPELNLPRFELFPPDLFIEFRIVGSARHGKGRNRCYERKQ